MPAQENHAISRIFKSYLLSAFWASILVLVPVTIYGVLFVPFNKFSKLDWVLAVWLMPGVVAGIYLVIRQTIIDFKVLQNKTSLVNNRWRKTVLLVCFLGEFFWSVGASLIIVACFMPMCFVRLAQNKSLFGPM